MEEQNSEKMEDSLGKIGNTLPHKSENEIGQRLGKKKGRR